VPSIGQAVLVSETIVLVPGSHDSIVLLTDWTEEQALQGNLLRRVDDGAEVWRVRPKHPPPDWFTSARIESGEIVAFSFSGYEVRIDLATGAELGRVFVK
jgi:hypothetical protein